MHDPIETQKSVKTNELHGAQPAPPPPSNSVGVLIVTALMSLVALKSLVMWMGAIYSDDPTPLHLFYLLGSIGLSIANLMFFIWRYSRIRRARGESDDDP